MKKSITVKIFFGFVAITGLVAISSHQTPAAAFEMKACLKGHSALECQCEQAIDIGSAAALKKFVVTYGRTRTSCNAAASTLGIKIPPKPTAASVLAAKNNNGLGNGDEGNCTGSGCSDPSNPGNGGTSGGGGGGGGSGGGGNGGGKGHNK